MLSGKHSVQFVITMDEDDETMNNPSMRQWLTTRQQNADIEFFYGNSQSKVEAVNANLEHAGQILHADIAPSFTDYR